jgi:hypothetical protein
MSSVTTSKSDQIQILAAVLFMIGFAAIFLLTVVGKDNIVGFACNYDGLEDICSNLSTPIASEDSDLLIPSKINHACVDANGLKISVAFESPITGNAGIQIFSTGPDFFPSGQGMTDTYEMRTTIATAVDHLDLVIPVASMPEGEQIFGNIIVSDEGVSSHVAYLINVHECSTNTALLPDGIMESINGVPEIYSMTCLPGHQLMIAFEFDKPVLGQYQALVANEPYQLASVVTQPAMLFFSGVSPQNGPTVIRLVSATNQAVVFEETFTPPVCNP